MIKVSESIELKALLLTDSEMIHQVKEQNRAHLAPWHDWATKKECLQDTQNFIISTQKEAAEGISLSLGVFYQDQFIGMLGFNKLDATMKQAEMGYWLAEKYTQKGIMTTSAKALIKYGIDVLEIRRFSIDCAVHNIKSQKVAERLGFCYEKLLPKNEKVGEMYFDHKRYIFEVKQNMIDLM